MLEMDKPRGVRICRNCRYHLYDYQGDGSDVCGKTASVDLVTGRTNYNRCENERVYLSSTRVHLGSAYTGARCGRDGWNYEPKE